jgi:hypothetical protein
VRVGDFQAAPRDIISAAAIGKEMAPAARLFDGFARRFLARDIRSRARDDNYPRPVDKGIRQHRAGVLHHTNRGGCWPDAAQDFLHAHFLRRKPASGKSAADGLDACARGFANTSEELFHRRIGQQKRIARTCGALCEHLAVSAQERPSRLRSTALDAENTSRLFMSSHPATIAVSSLETPSKK